MRPSGPACQELPRRCSGYSATTGLTYRWIQRPIRRSQLEGRPIRSALRLLAISIKRWRGGTAEFQHCKHLHGAHRSLGAATTQDHSCHTVSLALRGCSLHLFGATVERRRECSRIRPIQHRPTGTIVTPSPSPSRAASDHRRGTASARPRGTGPAGEDHSPVALGVELGGWGHRRLGGEA
jgi:hypothetical protein